MLKIINYVLLGLIVLGVGFFVFFKWSFIKESLEELKKVSWPSRELAWNSAIVTIVFIVFFSVFLALVDYVLNFFFVKMVG